MRIFRNAVEAREEILRDLIEMGVVVHNYSYQDKIVEGDPEFDTIELWGYTYSITGFHKELWHPLVEYCNLSEEYIHKEHVERTCGQRHNPGQSWETRKNTWSPFIERNGRFAYTYSERIAEMLTFYSHETQLQRTIRELKEHRSTRQAIVTIFDKHNDMDNFGGIGRIPCSMHYQFMIRNGRLHIIYSQRSCDFLTHFPYDMILAMNLADFVWIEIVSHMQEIGKEDIGIGHFIHQIGSLHMFRKDAPEGVF